MLKRKPDAHLQRDTQHRHHDRPLVRTIVLASRGLIGWTDLPAGCGLVFPHCKAIHSFGMRVLLAVLCLDERH
jgi:hypothetical protein